MPSLRAVLSHVFACRLLILIRDGEESLKTKGENFKESYTLITQMKLNVPQECCIKVFRHFAIVI